MIDPNRITRGKANEIAPGVWYVPALMANVYLVGEPGHWTLIDAGVKGTAWRILHAVSDAFGEGARPECIVLTHAHFDHVGALPDLVNRWNVPVYAHRLELPYLTGRSSYPPPDPTVGGFMSQLSRFFPNSPINIMGWARELNEDRSVPGLPGWEWVFTPGHSPGHVSLFRARDRVLIAGDAVITINQDNPLDLLSQRRIIRRPPSYFTQDWDAAEESVRTLADLEPHTLACGHGLPMAGPEVAPKLRSLAEYFRAPRRGRYLPAPAQADENGTRWVPPPVRDPVPGYLGAGLVAAAIVGVALRRR